MAHINKNKKTNNRQNAQPKNGGQKPSAIKHFRWTVFCGKIALLLAIITAVIIFTDKKEYFKADQSNNHVDRKWKSFYNFTKHRQVDVMLCGNSHIITGIDPFVLSCATGANCFILGTPGVMISDTYFTLGEALKYCKPKLVVLETYAIGGEGKDNGSMYQIMSFEAHRDFWYKLRMTPELFNSDSWVKAWSPTIRNHSFLLTNREQIKFNIEYYGKLLYDPNKLDLGRFARFEHGLQDSTLRKYDSIGAPVDGSKYEASVGGGKYLKKIMDLCKEKDIPVLFLTIPMYYKHIHDYEHWKAVVGEELKKYPESKWIDWQLPYDAATFTPEVFEDTYDGNQHLSNFGMTLTAYKLAGYLMQNNPYRLPDRSREKQWIADFRDQPHFLLNQDLPVGMTDAYAVAKGKSVGEYRIKEMLVQENQESAQVILKVQNPNNLGASINVALKLQFQDQIIDAPLQMTGFREIFPPAHKVYAVNIRKGVKVLDIVGIVPQ